MQVLSLLDIHLPQTSDISVRWLCLSLPSIILVPLFCNFCGGSSWETFKLPITTSQSWLTSRKTPKYLYSVTCSRFSPFTFILVHVGHLRSRYDVAWTAICLFPCVMWLAGTYHIHTSNKQRQPQNIIWTLGLLTKPSFNDIKQLNWSFRSHYKISPFCNNI